MFKNHIFLQNGASTLLDISLQNVMAHPAENLQVFDVSQTRWSSELAPQSSYKMNKMPWVLGLPVTTKCLCINYL
jgi:hypothetical protein